MAENRTVEELTLMNRVLFAEAIEDKQFAEDVQSIILGEDITLTSKPIAEKEIRNSSLQKFIRLDVWMEKEGGEILNTEVQAQKTQNIPKRSRYYQGMIDSKQLEPGETDFNKLEKVKIITIASFDLFGQGKYCYKFSMQCNEANGLELGDGGERIFFNTKGTDPENISNELMWMLRYFEETTREVAEQSGSERIMRMHEHVDKIKSNELFSFKYLRELEDRNFARKEARIEGLAEGRAEGLAEGLAEGRAEGKQEKARAIALKLKARGIPLENIAEDTGLTVEEIQSM